jgi:uncharacterized protein YndB with AHSA1/START domain
MHSKTFSLPTKETVMANELRLSRRIAATPDEVFDAWTRADALNQWMCPAGPGTTHAQLEARVGGRFRIDITDKGVVIPHDGEYLRLERPHLLEFTWVSPFTDQQRSVVTVELKAASAGATDLTLTHKLLPTAKAVDDHTWGWNACLDGIVARYAPPQRKQA